MKKYVFLALLVLVTLSYAQSPEKISYQAVIRDVSNVLISEQDVGIQIRILQGRDPSIASEVYAETQNLITNVNGLLSLEIGIGNSSYDFSAIDWSSGTYYIEMNIDPLGGTAYSIKSTSQLMSVPFALYAKTSGNGIGPEGPQGIQGEIGLQGEQGIAGPQGIQGERGLPGEQGLEGPQGIQGERGLPGEQGIAGPQGIQGDRGLQGEQGLAGSQGIQGERGLPGEQGIAGPQGIQGERGLPGEQGIVGPQGIQGERGLQGEQGLAGTQGIQGERGLQGEQGTAGTNGVQGPQGLQGLKGDQGAGGVTTAGDGISVSGSGTINDAYEISFNPSSTTLSEILTKGNSVNGQLKNVSEPTDEKDAVNMGYVDNIKDELANAIVYIGQNYLRRNGSYTATGNFNLDSHKIINLGVPTDEKDAVNLQFLNNKISELNELFNEQLTSNINNVIELLTTQIDDSFIDLVENLPTFTTYNIGDKAFGGIVFWVDETGQHGLVCTMEDQNSGKLKWGLPGSNTQAKGDGLYAGKSNTTMIIAIQGVGNYAAQICNDFYSVDSITNELYGDWYLPSIYELYKMYESKDILESVSVFSAFSNSYWSSNEFGVDDAWVFYFQEGIQTKHNKSNDFNVRAVRAF